MTDARIGPRRYAPDDPNVIQHPNGAPFWITEDEGAELTYTLAKRCRCRACSGSGYLRRGERVDNCDECDGYGSYIEASGDQALTNLTLLEWQEYNRKLTYLRRRYGTETPRSIADYWL